jgi:Flp pilus assembly pilin Flp
MAERAILTALVVLSVLTVLSRVGGPLSSVFERAGGVMEQTEDTGAGGLKAINQGDVVVN